MRLLRGERVALVGYGHIQAMVGVIEHRSDALLHGTGVGRVAQLAGKQANGIGISECHRAYMDVHGKIQIWYRM